MINIENIKYGWADLEIGYCSFTVSYLSDIYAEIDYLIDLNINESQCECKKAYLEGESAGDLTLISYITWSYDNKDGYPVINIIWRRLYCDDENTITMFSYPYYDFIEEWKKVKEENQDIYKRNFLMEEEQ